MVIFSCLLSLKSIWPIKPTCPHWNVKAMNSLMRYYTYPPARPAQEE